MTASQMIRAERRAERARLEREERAAALSALLTLALILAVFAIVGTSDLKAEQAELAYWESMGVTIQRW